MKHLLILLLIIPSVTFALEVRTLSWNAYERVTGFTDNDCSYNKEKDQVIMRKNSQFSEKYAEYCGIHELCHHVWFKKLTFNAKRKYKKLVLENNYAFDDYSKRESHKLLSTWISENFADTCTYGIMQEKLERNPQTEYVESIVNRPGVQNVFNTYLRCKSN